MNGHPVPPTGSKVCPAVEGPSCISYRRSALKLKWAPFLFLLNFVNQASYAEFAISKLGNVYRLKGPADPAPQIEISETQKQGGDCKGGRTLDLVLRFPSEPTNWLDGSDVTEGPCSILARPLDTGGFEIRLSYLVKGTAKLKMDHLVFISSQRFIVDHWISEPAPTIAKKGAGKRSGAKGSPEVLAKHAEAAPSAKIDGGLGASFENQSSWEKILGTAAVALDFNSPELDRFRSKSVERNQGLPKEPVERRGLRVPLIDLPPLDNNLDFAEQKINLTRFAEASLPEAHGKDQIRQRDAALQGVNLVVILMEKGEWFRARKSIDILEKSASAKFLPTADAKWWAYRGLIEMKAGQQLNSRSTVVGGIDLWRDGLRTAQGWGGEAQEYLEYMALESVRHLFEQNLVYAAASVLSWTRRYSWSSATEERFAYLRAEAFYRLGLEDEARGAFSEYVNARKEIPVTSFSDRRLVSAAAFRLGDLELRAGNYKPAVDAYTRAFVEGPKVRKFSFEGNWLSDDVRLFPYVLFNRAEAFVRLGQEDSALRDLRAFLFVAPSDPQAGLVYFRIGELLDELGGEETKIMGAWRECLFKVPKSLGGSLCGARKSARELRKAPKRNWPRLVADIEDALTSATDNNEAHLNTHDLRVYLNLLLADAFITLGEPYQALLRLDTLQALSVSPYMGMWLREYLVASDAGYGDRLVREKNYKEVVADYEKRRTILFLDQTRPEVLWNLSRAYQGLGLIEQAMTTLEAAEKARDRIRRTVMRPYDRNAADWAGLRASLEVDFLVARKTNASPVRAKEALEKSDAARAEVQRLWIRYAEATDDPALEAKWWGTLEQSSGLAWDEVRRFSSVLKRVKRDADRRDLLERRVGSWFGEREKNAAANPPTPELLAELFEARADSSRRETAIAVADYLTELPDEKLGKDVTKPMILYRKGTLLRELGRSADARQSFERAKLLSPEGVWGRLATSALSELK